MENTIEKNVTAFSPENLEKAWKGIELAKPNIRIRDAAKALDVSEVQLLATTVGTESKRLQGSWTDLLLRFKKLGKVMSLTRNEACVLEHKGTFQKIDIQGEGNNAVGTVIGPIETRVFFRNWDSVFAVKNEKEGKVLQSIQVFDKYGEAVTKIYLQDKSDVAAYEQLVSDFLADDQSRVQQVEKPVSQVYNDENVDAKTFLQDWSELKDTHDFFPMLRKHKVSRYHALVLSENMYSFRISNNATEKILNYASGEKLPIMIFVGNNGNIQIHQGKVRTIRMLERGKDHWLNVLDPDFNMHLNMGLVHSSWAVYKPTADGDVVSIELFDKNKEMIAQLFGLRKPGLPQNPKWKSLIEEIQKG